MRRRTNMDNDEPMIIRSTADMDNPPNVVVTTLEEVPVEMCANVMAIRNKRQRTRWIKRLKRRGIYKVYAPVTRGYAY